ncbi:MAG: diacylglycerol kinase family protein [Novosphingobium sp.]
MSPLWLVTNAASGSNSEAAVDDLVASLSASGCAPARIIRFPDEDLPARELLEAEGVATLAIFTGDGTINTAASALEGWQGALLVLPGGTQNLLSKSLHGDVPAEEVTGKLATARRVRRNALRTSQGVALVELLAGPGAMWADVRESVRDLDLSTMAETFTTALRETREGAGVRVADPAGTGKPEGYRAVRMAPIDADCMEADGFDFADWGEFAAQGFAMLVKRDFRQGPHDELGRFPSVLLESESAIALMIDGERRDGGKREKVTCEEFTLDFLATSSPET